MKYLKHKKTQKQDSNLKSIYSTESDLGKLKAMKPLDSYNKLNIVLILAMLQPSLLHANPSNPSYDPVQVTITGLGTDNVTIYNSPNAIIDWGGFDIAVGETTHIEQDNSSSSLLNRVSGNPTEIFGTLTSNGRVFVINPNGILVGAGATIDTAGFIASTLNITNDDFLNGRLHFEDADNAASIINRGFIHTSGNGEIVLIAPNITNENILSTEGGSITLAAGKSITLSALSDPNIQFEIQAPENTVLNLGQLITRGGSANIFAGSINNSGEINANSVSTDSAGNIVLRALDDINLNVGSLISANGKTAGSITLTASGNNDENNHSVIFQQGEIQANGDQAGNINLTADSIISSSAISANGTQQGGHINLKAKDSILATHTSRVSVNSTNGQAGTIEVDAGDNLLTSATYTATGQQGGRVTLAAAAVKLASATVDVSGTQGGGDIRIGGGFAGKDSNIKNSQQTLVNSQTQLIANTTQQGDGGSVAVWSDGETRFYGKISATGGVQSGNGGRAEVSALHQNYTYAGVTDLSATNGLNGQLLLDPQNITIIDGTAQIGVLELLDPNAAANNRWGSFQVQNGILELTNGNIVVAHRADNTTATNAGAVYVFAADGTLISALMGTQASDQVGSGGLTQLVSNNGNNFVTATNSWDNGAITDAGAVTWINGNTGLNGIVDSSNSLVGTTPNDLVGLNVTALTNGNYVVESSRWDNAGTVDAGAATWVNGSNGQTIDGLNTISQANSIVGDVSDGASRVGSNGITALSNGNYVVASALSNASGINLTGAVTWGNGATGTAGNVADISLTGGTAGNRIGNGGVVEVGNSNYVVVSREWEVDANSANADAGAVTWVDGTNGFVRGASSVSATVSSSNSLVGSNGGDQVGQFGVTRLSNGNYVVVSPNVSMPSTQLQIGAVTWGDGNLGVVGDILSSQSIFGSTSNDQVGLGGITALSNGHYVVLSPEWINTQAFTAFLTGAVTWADGTQATNMTVSSTNSLTGSNDNDLSNSNVTALTNGNYVVAASAWANTASVPNAGAATWINGANGQDVNGLTGSVISAANSLVGANSNARVGSDGVTALSNGNYVVNSPSWTDGTTLNLGAATWGNGANGSVFGAVSAANSLIGSTAGDFGANSIIALTNGHYVVANQFWDNGTTGNAGAITWGDGTRGITGTISSANSVVGTTANDQVGLRIEALNNGNYVFVSNHSNLGVNVGAVTWADGSAATTGTINASNSLLGEEAGDLSSAVIEALTTGDYVISAADLDNGTLVNVGAVIMADGNSELSGNARTAVANGRGIMGEFSNDKLSESGGFPGAVYELSNGRVMVLSSSADTTVGTNAGRVHILSNSFFDGSEILSPTGNATVTTGSIVASLETGTDLVLQASNDITQMIGANINVVGPGLGGNLTLQAGRSITLNADINTNGGDLTLIANDNLISGVVNADRLSGAGNITMTTDSFLTVNNLIAEIRNGENVTLSQKGKINLINANINASSITLIGDTDATVIDNSIAQVSNVQEDFLTILNEVSDYSLLDGEEEDKKTLQCR